MARSRDPPLSFQEIASRVDRAKATIIQRSQKLKKLPYLQEAMK